MRFFEVIDRLRVDDFSYELPERLIAQTPAQQRSESRLLVLDRLDGSVSHTVFSHLPDFLRPGDMIVANDSRVIPARLLGVKEGTGAAIECLLLRPRGEAGVWETLVRPGRRLRTGQRVAFGDLLTGVVRGEGEDGTRMIEFSASGNDFDQLLERLGTVPLPPYIRERLEDPERYQTVYARRRGSVAAPTAGLHFTESLLQDVRDQGIGVEFVTLHIGLGTFRPVSADRIEDHHMHEEWFSVGPEVLQLIMRTRASGGRVVCIGTTVVRALETAFRMMEDQSADDRERLEKDGVTGYTRAFIYPGYHFRVVDGLVTNFHLPKSTLLMLVSALAGRERVLSAYEEAVRREYRFFSFGDAMLII